MGKYGFDIKSARKIAIFKASEKIEALRILNEYHLSPYKYVFINPSAKDIKKRWDSSKFALIGDYLSEKGLKIVFAGREEEKRTIKRIKRLMGKKAIDLSGKIGLGVFAELLKTSALLVTNDIGASHLSAAVRTPSVIIFSGLPSSERWVPIDHEKHIAISFEESQDLGSITLAIDKLVPKEFCYQLNLLKVPEDAFYL